MGGGSEVRRSYSIFKSLVNSGNETEIRTSCVDLEHKWIQKQTRRDPTRLLTKHRGKTEKLEGFQGTELCRFNETTVTSYGSTRIWQPTRYLVTITEKEEE
ncbi:CIC11C00000000222 [Sungouiella intermedia]|uniref:CIC11C00000000222 n=1 Tax=Sungouiella intermedia TaxID=45354 RepID=A0A1L0BG61_9ASCO|nr:CIC11C00000000222 [[Candida] intermedia]